MRRVLVLLILGACSTSPLPVPPGVSAEDPRVAECRREARDDPALRELGRSRGSGADAEERWRIAMRETQSRAFRSCLEQAGLMRAGVEAVQPRAMGSGGVVVPPQVRDARY